MLWQSVVRTWKSYSLRKTVAAAIVFCSAITANAADSVMLDEPASDARVHAVSEELNVTGKLRTTAGGGKVFALNLDVKAQFVFRERRLTGAGRDAESLRSLRHYDKASATIKVEQQSTTSRLNPQRNRIVAQGQREGIQVYSPTGPLSFDDLELLRTPGDSLAILGLLPGKMVAVGESWKPDSWVIQTLTGVEAVLKSDLSCRLESVANQQAKVTFEGRIEGAIVGAATTLQVSGHYVFDVEKASINYVRLTQTEKRSVGSVSPGVDVTATVTLRRSLAESPGPLSNSAAEAIPLDPPAEQLQLRLDLPWQARLTFGRDWHIFHQNQEVAVMRLLDKGSLIAQCNISPVPAAEPGQHTPATQFVADIKVSLKDKLKSIADSGPIDTGGKFFLYRVTAVGQSDGIPMQWTYFLCASPSGKQVAFVFAVEQKLLDRFGNRDVAITKNLQFATQSRKSD